MNLLQTNITRESRIAAARYRSEMASRSEEIRQLLLQAAYIDIARVADTELFDGPACFGEEGVSRLARYGYPFAGALRIASVAGLNASPDNVFYQRLLGSTPAALTQRFDAVKIKIGTALKDFVKDRKVVSSTVPTDTSPSISVYNIY